jgi:hypothetical protein
MMTSARDCGQIHELYAAGTAEEILSSFYFNSWAGTPDSADRLLSLLRAADMGDVPGPSLDSKLDYVGPDAGTALMTFDLRGRYDTALIERIFANLPRGSSAVPDEVSAHRAYITSARRRFYFECVDDDRAQRMLPYRSAADFLWLIDHPDQLIGRVPWIIGAINRGEGLTDPDALGEALALQPQEVRGGTVRSYRLFPAANLSLTASGSPPSAYLEGGPDHLVLRYRGTGGPATPEVTLRIGLDLYDLLYRLADGYLPGIRDEQGRYRDLAIFKNELSAAPYREVLLTAVEMRPRAIRRLADGQLIMKQVVAEAGEPKRRSTHGTSA